MAALFRGAAAKTTAPFTIRQVKSADRYLKMLIYGDFGVGKTTLAATSSEVPEMQDVILGNVESGDMSISDTNIDAVDITSFAQFARFHEFLRAHCAARDRGDIKTLARLEMQFRGLSEPPESPKQYHTVIIDSLTEVQKLAMYQLLGIQIDEAILDVEPDSPKFAEWGKSAEMIRLLVRSFRNLAMHVIFVASQQIETDDRKRQHRKPALPGKLANEVQGFLDVVGYYIAASPTDGAPLQRRLYLDPGVTYQAKNRFIDFKDSFIDEPTMADLFRLSRSI